MHIYGTSKKLAQLNNAVKRACELKEEARVCVCSFISVPPSQLDISLKC